MKNLVSIIILNYNNYNLTINCLKSLNNQTYKHFEVILIDNGSDKPLYKELKKELKNLNHNFEIQLIRSEKNLYFGAGTNKAIKIAKGDYLCLLNYDTLVEPNFIEEMVIFLENNPNAGMITPKIYYYDNKKVIWNAGSSIDFKTPLVVKNRGLLEYDPDGTRYDKVEEIGYAPGTAMFVRREIIEEIGLIDEIYMMYYEDPDWNIRAQRKGYKSYYVPTAVIYHNVPLNTIKGYKMLFWWDSEWRKKLRDKNLKIYRGSSKPDKNDKAKGPRGRNKLFMDYFFKRNTQILVWKFAGIKDLFVFYLNYFKMIFLVIIFNPKYIDFYRLLYSIWKGFVIGVRKRTNRSCSKHITREYHYIRNLQTKKY